MKCEKTYIMEELRKKGLEPEEISEHQIKVKVDKDTLLNHLAFMQTLGFEHLSFITAVDYIGENEFEVVYPTWSHTHKIHVLNKVRIDRKAPKLPTIVSMWEQAQFYEQEVHEFFGIVFEGNKDLSPLFLENYQDIPPLRKDFNTREYSDKRFNSLPAGGEK